MAILVDVDQLEADGVLNANVAQLLRHHAVRETGSTAINMLLAFGGIAMAAGLLAMVPAAGMAAIFGFLFILLGWLITRHHSRQWGKLGSIWMIVGALIFAGAIGALTQDPLLAPLAAAIVLGFVSVLAQSSLLMAFTPLALAAALGGSTGYWHATYELSVKEPTITILAFTSLGLLAWSFAQDRRGVAHRLSIVFARMCVILVNFGFWIGALWGDDPGESWRKANASAEVFSKHHVTISEVVFILGWAVALFAAGAWGARNGRRFMVNSAAVFGAILFYTEWFEHLGMHAFTVMASGVLTILFALGLWRYNRRTLQ